MVDKDNILLTLSQNLREIRWRNGVPSSDDPAKYLGGCRERCVPPDPVMIGSHVAHGPGE